MNIPESGDVLVLANDAFEDGERARLSRSARQGVSLKGLIFDCGINFFSPSNLQQLLAIISNIKDLQLRGEKLQASREVPSAVAAAAMADRSSKLQKAASAQRRRNAVKTGKFQRNSKSQTPKAWADIIGLGSQ